MPKGNTGKATNKTKKRVGFGLIIIIIIAALFIAASFFLGIKIKFELRDELNIVVTPLDASFSVKNNEQIQFEPRIVNNNFVQCKSRCEFKLTDLKNTTLVHSETKTLSHNEEVIRSYLLPAPGKGSGQFLYNFEVKCNNIRSVVCLTKEVPRHKSVIVTVNYELTDEEKDVKNRTKTDIESWLSGIKEVSETAEQNGIISGRLSDSVKEKTGLLRRGSEAKSRLNEIKKQREGLISLWNSEEYMLLGDRFTQSNIDRVGNLKNELTGIQKDIINIINLRNENIGLLGELAALKQKIIDMADFYKKESNANNNQVLNELNQAAGKVYLNYLIIKENKSYYEKSLNNELSVYTQEIKNKVNSFDEMVLRGLFLLIYGESLLEIKNGLASGASYEFSCDNIKDLKIRIDNANSDAIAFRANYTDAVDPALLNKIKIEIELKALEKAREYIEGSLIYGKEFLLNLVSEEIASRTEPRYSTKIPVSDLYKMVLLNNSGNSIYSGSNCRDVSYNQTADTESVNNLLVIDVSSFEEISLDIPFVEVYEPTELKENPPRCCVLGKCVECCEENCADSEEMYPILFIHGHVVNDANTPEFTMDAFAKIQKKILEGGYINAGELNIRISPYDVIEGEWSRNRNPISVRASYYYITHYEVGAYSIEMQKSERIENYAIRLREIINLLKYRTGAKKVNIIAHSMGGLVTRQYLDLFGANDVDKVITVNTPHNGITGKVKKFCSIFGASKECNDMSEGSIFLERLNSKQVPKDVDFHVIRSTGCKMDYGKLGDGIATEESAYLEGAENYLIEGKCTDTLQTNLHTNVLNPDLYPETYKLILDILKDTE